MSYEGVRANAPSHIGVNNHCASVFRNIYISDIQPNSLLDVVAISIPQEWLVLFCQWFFTSQFAVTV